MQLQQENIVIEERHASTLESLPVTYGTKTKALDVSSVRRTAYCATKRTFDVVSAFCLLLVISPVMIIIAVAIKLDSEGPVLYRHRRIGIDGKAIFLWKFRSMVTNADALIQQFTAEQKREWEQNFKLQNDPRVTRVGQFLRQRSLDELPQLFNIIIGDISVVGPRPVVEEELKKYGFNQSRLLSQKPGLTGYWQVNGRSAVTYEERMKMELYYIANASFKLDFVILMKSFSVVFRKVGAI